jgi:2-aminoethylphosphonate-pyruvate transaminase
MRMSDRHTLLTPGPVALPISTRRAMLDDYGSAEDHMVRSIAFTRQYLLQLANSEDCGTAIPLPGSATYANEAVIRTLVPPDGKLLVHANGAYGQRLVEICRAAGTAHSVLRTAPGSRLRIERLREELRRDPAVTHVMMVHIETSTGLLNPLEDAATVCREFDKALLVDAVASFGAFNLDWRQLNPMALVLTSNKCLEGPPGLGWAIVSKTALRAAAGRARSLSLDLWAQNEHMDHTGCFRFTPPTHVMMGVAAALRSHAIEGSAARLGRYRATWSCLVAEMRRIGFDTLLADSDASPIVATFHDPDDEHFDFRKFCSTMADAGFQIFPSRIGVSRTFRIGCIGALSADIMPDVAHAAAEVLGRLGVRRFGRAGLRTTPVPGFPLTPSPRIAGTQAEPRGLRELRPSDPRNIKEQI